jgi:hypothetical protein
MHVSASFTPHYTVKSPYSMISVLQQDSLISRSNGLKCLWLKRVALGLETILIINIGEHGKSFWDPSIRHELISVIYAYQ